MTNRTYEKFSPAIIDNLRSEMNKGLVFEIYSNYKDKDMWSIICSAMDWIQTAIDGIDPTAVIQASGLEASRQMILFISCIDILRKSVKQLNYVFGLQKAKHPKVFKREPLKKYIDGNKSVCFAMHTTDDDRYFDTIRSCFAAHAVELNDFFTEDNKEKRYASWSTDGMSDGDYSVTLYSEKPNESNIYMSIHFDELVEFAKQRYEHLEDIANKAKCIKRAYMDLFRGKLLSKDPDTPEQWSKLHELECECDNGVDAYEFVNLEFILQTPISNANNAQLVFMYRSLLHRSIDQSYFDFALPKNNKSKSSISNINLWGQCPNKYVAKYQEFCNIVFWDRLFLLDDDYSLSEELLNLNWDIANIFSEYLENTIDIYDHCTRAELYVLIQVGLFFKENPHLMQNI